MIKDIPTVSKFSTYAIKMHVFENGKIIYNNEVTRQASIQSSDLPNKRTFLSNQHS